MSRISNILKIREDHISKREDTIGKGKNKMVISASRIQDIKEIILSHTIIEPIPHSKGRSINSSKLTVAEGGGEARGVEDVVDSTEDKICNKK